MQKMNFILVLAFASLMAACTVQERKVLDELENMPGITCEFNDVGVEHCGPDKVQPNPGA